MKLITEAEKDCPAKAACSCVIPAPSQKFVYSSRGVSSNDRQTSRPDRGCDSNRDRSSKVPYMSLTRVIEALLFSAQKPLSIHEITAAIKAAEGDPARKSLTSSRARKRLQKKWRPHLKK